MQAKQKAVWGWFKIMLSFCHTFQSLYLCWRSNMANLNHNSSLQNKIEFILGQILIVTIVLSRTFDSLKNRRGWSCSPLMPFYVKFTKIGRLVTAELYTFYSIIIHIVWQVFLKLHDKEKEAEYFKLIKIAHSWVIWLAEIKHCKQCSFTLSQSIYSYLTKFRPDTGCQRRYTCKIRL